MSIGTGRRRVPPADAGPIPSGCWRPFDPVVWDRRRFELLWAWGYRFEAYTPLSKRRLGYYALPLLWGDRVIGWGKYSVARTARSAPTSDTSGCRREGIPRSDVSSRPNWQRM